VSGLHFSIVGNYAFSGRKSDPEFIEVWDSTRWTQTIGVTAFHSREMETVTGGACAWDGGFGEIEIGGSEGETDFAETASGGQGSATHMFV